MPTLNQITQRVIEQADILLMVLDARSHVTFNQNLLDRIKERKIIYVINKIDLVPETEWKEFKKLYKPSVAVSSTKHLGTVMLLKKINQLCHGEDVKVGVIGYPNTGKSSLINALKSRGSASVSPRAGHTRALQYVRVSANVLLIDSPGVIQQEDRTDADKQDKLAMIGTIDVHRVKDPEQLAMRLMQEHPGLVETYYAVEINEDFEETLAAIALKKHILLKKEQPDTMRMAKQILFDYQAGKFNA